ncbi:hypothetical protein JCM1840_000538 [Sporobolomyces johnsonii]
MSSNPAFDPTQQTSSSTGGAATSGGQPPFTQPAMDVDGFTLQDLVAALQVLQATPQAAPTIPAPVVPVTPVANKSSSVLAKLYKFSSRVKDSTQFVYSVMALLSDHTKWYNTIEKKILFFSLSLEGSALQWFLGLLRHNATNYFAQENLRRLAQYPPLEPLTFNANFQFDSTLYPFVLPELVSFDAFLRYFNISFADPNARSTTKCKCITSMFYANLKPAIKDEVHCRGKPGDLTSMITLAIQVDNYLLECKLEHPEESAFRDPRPLPRFDPSRAPAGPPCFDMPRPSPGLPGPRMAATNVTAFLRLLPADREHQFNNHLCLYCGQPDHIINTCPTKPAHPSTLAAATSTPSATINDDDSNDIAPATAESEN